MRARARALPASIAVATSERPPVLAIAGRARGRGGRVAARRGALLPRTEPDVGRVNVLVEAVGSLAWPTLLPFLRPVARKLVALEVDPQAAGAYLVDRCVHVPRYAALTDPKLLLDICEREGIELAFPSVNEGLHVWSQQREVFEKRGVEVVLSPAPTLSTFQDKWETFRFFRRHGIPTPDTSLRHDFELVKPRIGRGGAGVRRVPPGTLSCMDGLVSQRLLRGREFSADLLCDRDGRLVYAVQRERLGVVGGLSVRGRVIQEPEVDRALRRLAACAHFYGIVNVQGFLEPQGVSFTEVNPRIPGGLSLSMAATENWFAVLLKLREGRPIEPVEPRRGLTMLRHYQDVFVDAGELRAALDTSEPTGPCREAPSPPSS